MRATPLRRWRAFRPLRTSAILPLAVGLAFAVALPAHAADAPPKPAAAAAGEEGIPAAAFVLTAGGTLAPPGNDLPTASGERLAASLAGPVPSRLEGGALLADGDLLTGYAASLQAGTAVVVSGVGGRLEIPGEKLAALITSPVATANPLDVPAGFSGALLANGERVAGTPAFLNEAQAGVDTGKRVVQIPRNRVAALVLRPPEAPAKACVRVRLATGDRLSGMLTARDGAWVVRLALGYWTLPVAQVRGWWAEGPDRIALTALPVSASYTGDLKPPLVPLGVDRTADGDWLRLGAVRCDRGLAARAGTTATIALTGGWRSLVAVLAVGRGGPAVFRVSADGKQVFDSGPVAAGVPRAVLVPVAGAKSLALSVVNVQDDAIPAQAVWGWTTLVK